MLWGRSTEPSKHKALCNARYAISGYIQGTERAYLVEAALQDVRDAYRVELDLETKAKQALTEEDEEKRLALMQEALQEVTERLSRYG